VLVVYKLGDFAHCRIELQIFVSIFAIFMSSRDFHADEDLVRMNLSYGALFRAAIDANAIADLQHFPFLSLANITPF